MADLNAYEFMIKQLRASRNLYPNASTIAEFRPHSQTLHFHYMDAQLLKEDMKLSKIGSNRKNFEALIHELTHWSDQVSTVWGQRYLIKLFDAYDAMTANDEIAFEYLSTQFDEDRRILFPKYYHVVDKGVREHGIKKRWRQELSSGLEFGADGKLMPEKPIFFVRFGDHDDGTRIARQPLSVGALLETTASWAEIRVAISAIGALPADERLVEQKLFEEEKRKFIYNENLTLYTAPVHMLSNQAGTADLVEAYEKAALLAHVALNLTPDLIQGLKHPESFAPFGDRLAAFVRDCNRGYVFAAMSAHTHGVDPNLPLNKWLETVLRRSNLPTLEKIRFDAYQDMELLYRQVSLRNELDKTRDILLDIGRRRFLKNASSSITSFDPLGDLEGPLPQFFDRTGTLFGLNGSQEMMGHEPIKMFDAEFQLFKYTDNFMQGCRGLTDIDIKH